MKIERHAPGAPCWVDLATTDQAAAKAFYGELFGWSYEDMPMDEAGQQRYSMASLDGSFAAAIFTQQEEQRQKGIPPCWNVHLTVEDVDATAGRVSELGGSLLMEPFNVFESGRMAMLSDPTGAVVALWQPRNHVGAGVKYEPGAMAWCEVMTTDTDVATVPLGEPAFRRPLGRGIIGAWPAAARPEERGVRSVRAAAPVPAPTASSRARQRAWRAVTAATGLMPCSASCSTG